MQTKRSMHLPVLVASEQEAHIDLLGSETIAVVLPKRKPGGNTVVGTLEDAAVLVVRRNSEAVVVALLVALALSLGTENLALNGRDGHVEVVVAALAAATSLPVLDLPGPVLGDGNLAAGNGASNGGGSQKSDGGEGDHFDVCLEVFGWDCRVRVVLVV